MPKSKQQKQKDREKRVAKKKQAAAARRRELAKTEEKTDIPRAKKVIAAGMKQPKPQVNSQKPTVTHRRSGG